MRNLFLYCLLLISSVLYSAPTAEEHYSALIEAQGKKEWDKMVTEATELLENFSDSPYSTEALFYSGVGYFEQEDFDWANRQFSAYLQKQVAPKHFEEAIKYKFEIAERFRQGYKKHLLGMKKLPQWQPAHSDALTLYDEVISALPHNDLAAHSLFGKAQLMVKEEDYRSSIEAYQTLIRRFPKHPLAAEAYIGINQVYLTQSEVEYPDPDFLDLSEINLRKFRTAFPRSERLPVAEGVFAKMQEHYASNLFETARFYERTKKYSAAALYYSKIVSGYPNTKVAKTAEKRLPVVQAKCKTK